MDRRVRTYTIRCRRALVVTASLAMALGGTPLSPTVALAVTQETKAELSETQKAVESSASTYEKASENVEKLNERIEENSRKIEELEAQMPELQERAGRAMSNAYKSTHETNFLMSLVLGSESLDQMLARIGYLTQVQERNNRAVEELNEARESLEVARTDLDRAKDQAESEQKKASAALDEAKKLRREAQQKAEAEREQELAELKRAQQEAEAKAKAAAEAAKKEAASGGSSKSDSGSSNNGGSSVPEPAVPDNSEVDWDADKSAFVSKWTRRIDAYLAGSPLAGHGKDFAVAAWKYGVDPRFSPAISNTESSKGLYCFASHNAWGWGSASWDSWEEAIDAHVSGLAAGYGYTISVEGAKRYCPPTWYEWYCATLSEMNKI